MRDADVGALPLKADGSGGHCDDNHLLRSSSRSHGATAHLGVVHEGIETTIAVVLGELPPPPTETATAIEWPASLDGAIDLGLMLAASAALLGSERPTRTECWCSLSSQTDVAPTSALLLAMSSSTSA
jgi:hypothetical protein